jgi:hypothetical protein
MAACTLFGCIASLVLLSGAVALHVQPHVQPATARNRSNSVHVLQRGFYRREHSGEVVKIDLSSSDHCGIRVFKNEVEAAVRCYYDGFEIIGFDVEVTGEASTTFKIIDS